MIFARPAILLLLLALPIWWWRRARKRGPTAAYSDVRQLGGAERRRRWIAELPAGLRSVALAAWVLAAAGPQWGSSVIETTSEGIAIMLAVDVSSSMLARDFGSSDRLDVAKEQSIAFLRGREHDRIGLVTFAGQALTKVPLTVDYAVLEETVGSVRVGELEDGTAIGTAIAIGANRLRQAPNRSRVMVLVTDGENTRGMLDPRTAAEAAAKVGVKIYTIGVGSEGEAPIPIGRGAQGRVRYQTLPVRLDEELLRSVATITNGRYFRAGDPEALSRIFAQIDELEKTPVTVTRYAGFDEAFRVPLVIGLVALGLELLLSATAVVRIP